MIDQVATDHRVDSKRVYMTGFSQGGQTTQSLGRRMSDVLAAIAPNHGHAANGFTVGPDEPMAMIQVWGDSDRVVDSHGVPSSDGMVYDGAMETAEIWSDAQGCAATATTYPTVSDGSRGWSCLGYDGCASDAEVVSCRWDGAHTWASNRALGNFGMNAMWPFLMRHHKP
jgi:polyhydroxybutyrate depolymerase